MKKTSIALLVICLLSGACSVVSAQTTLGVLIGPSVPNLSGGTNELSQGYVSRLALHFGITVERDLNERFSIQPELMFDQQGGQRNGLKPFTLPTGGYHYADFKNASILNYLEVPVLLRYKFGADASPPGELSVPMSDILQAHRKKQAAQASSIRTRTERSRRFPCLLIILSLYRYPPIIRCDHGCHGQHPPIQCRYPGGRWRSSSGLGFTVSHTRTSRSVRVHEYTAVCRGRLQPYRQPPDLDGIHILIVRDIGSEALRSFSENATLGIISQRSHASHPPEYKNCSADTESFFPTAGREGANETKISSLHLYLTDGIQFSRLQVTCVTAPPLAVAPRKGQAWRSPQRRAFYFSMLLSIWDFMCRKFFAGMEGTSVLFCLGRLCLCSLPPDRMTGSRIQMERLSRSDVYFETECQS